MKKIILSSIAMAMFFAGSLGLFILVACSGPKPVNEEGTQEKVEAVVLVEKETDSDNLVALVVEEPSPVAHATTPARKESSSNNYSSSSSYSSSYSDETEEGDYWSEKRKHSPNDNYLLGFDEDVDDVHDMELYIEDY